MSEAPKLSQVIRLDSLPLNQTYFTPEGYLMDRPILTSTGIFEYTNPDGSVRRELRLPEEVFAAESLASYQGKPIIITHDAGLVDKDNVQKHQIGTILTEGYPDIGAPNWEIIVAAAAEQIAGAGLILWTCREGELLENALEACARWGLHFDAVNDSLPSWKKFYGNETRKVGATEYWDDKAYRVQNGKLMKEAAHEMD